MFAIGLQRLGMIAIAVAALGVLRSVPANDDGIDDLSVRRWVARLDADRKADRQRAEEELLKLGPSALKWLPEPESLGTRSASEAVRRVRAKLERRKAEESVEATRLTKGGRQPIGQMLNRLAQETGNSIAVDDLPRELSARSIELPDGSTFWNVIEATSRLENLAWNFEGSPSRLRLFPESATARNSESSRLALVVADTKAFRIAAKSVRERIVVGQNSGPLMRLELNVMSEPRLRPLFLKCAASEVVVTGLRKDSKEQKLWSPFSPDAKFELTFGQGHRDISVPLDFRKPQGEWESLTVTGKLNVETAAGEEVLEFPAGAEARGVSRRRGGVTVKVLRWEPVAGMGDNSLEVTALVTYDTGGPAFESHRSWMLYNVVGLTRSGVMPAAKAEKSTSTTGTSLIRPTNTEHDVEPDGSIAVTYRFQELPLPASEYHLRYAAPTLILDVPLQFELREVPLRMGR